MAGMKRPRLRFTIRELLWATFGIGLGMMLCQIYWARDSIFQVELAREMVRFSFPLILVPIGGLIGTFFRRPIFGALAGFAICIPLIPLVVPLIQVVR